MAIDPRELRNVMGHFATGVTVITTKDKTDKPFGLTANAFSSLSLDPPLLLVCVDKTVDCYACFEDSKVFAVNVLSLEQEELSTRFATKGIEKFEGVSYSLGGLGVPLLDGALAHIECRVAAGYEGRRPHDLHRRGPDDRHQPTPTPCCSIKANIVAWRSKGG